MVLTFAKRATHGAASSFLLDPGPLPRSLCPQIHRVHHWKHHRKHAGWNSYRGIVGGAERETHEKALSSLVPDLTSFGLKRVTPTRGLFIFKKKTSLISRKKASTSNKSFFYSLLFGAQQMALFWSATYQSVATHMATKSFNATR